MAIFAAFIEESEMFANYTWYDSPIEDLVTCAVYNERL